MAVPIYFDDESDPGSNMDVSCSACHAQFVLQWRRSTAEGMRFCPFCGEEFEEESDDQ